MQNAHSLLLDYFGNQYLEIGEQSVEYIGMCNFDEKFVVGGNEEKDQKISEINEIITPLYSIQLGKSTIENIKLNKMIETGKIIAFLSKNASIIIDDAETKNLDNMIVMPSFEINPTYTDADFNKILSLIKTEGYIVYENQKEYQNILDKINVIKEKTGIQYSYIENLNFIPLNQCYFMPKYLALFFVVLGETLFYFYMLLMLKLTQRIASDSKIINVLFVLFIITVVTYELSYLILMNIQDKALLLNIMRIRYTVMVELLITFIICVLVIGCNVFKKLSKGGIVNESNRCN